MPIYFIIARLRMRSFFRPRASQPVDEGDIEFGLDRQTTRIDTRILRLSLMDRDFSSEGK